MMRAIALCMLMLPLTAAAQPTSCPLVLQKEAVDVRAPAGWRGYNAAIVRLTGFGMMAGPPESMTYLVPFKVEKKKGIGVQTWVFGGSDEKWLYCTYDGGAAIQISRRMPDSATECTLEYKVADLGGIAAMHASCSSAPLSQAAGARSARALAAGQP